MTVFSVVRANGIASLVDAWEYKQEWCDEKSVHGEQRNDEVPDLAECSLGIYEIPFELGDTVDDLVLLVSIFVDIINHHFLEVGLSHLLKTGLESKLVGVTSCFVPKLSLAFVLLAVGHFVPLDLLAIVVGL